MSTDFCLLAFASLVDMYTFLFIKPLSICSLPSSNIVKNKNGGSMKNMDQTNKTHLTFQSLQTLL